MSAARDRRVRNLAAWLPTLAGLAALLLFSGLHRAAPEFYQASLQVIGIVPTQEPFLDTSYVLAAAECRNAGVDVYLANPCDPTHRTYDYSPLLIALLPGGTTVALTPAAGSAAAVLFFLSLAWLPSPERRRDQVVVMAATLSTMTAYAVERGNIDVAIFPLLVASGALATRSAGWRCLGCGLTLFASFIKFYPAAALLLIARERRRAALLAGGAAVLAIAGFVLLFHADLLRGLANRPVGFNFTDAFAAANLPRGFAEMASPAGERYPVLQPVLAATPLILLILLILRAARQGLSLARRSFAATLPALPLPHLIFLTLGAAIVTGCFLTGLNFYYRGIFLLLTLPGLLALGRSDPGANPSRVPVRTAHAILFLMWSECLRQAIVHGLPAIGLSNSTMNEVLAFFWLARELVWWRIIGVLLGIILAFAVTSESWRWLRLPALSGSATQPSRSAPDAA